MTSRRAHPEQDVQRALVLHLRWRGAPGLFFFHPANGGWRSAAEARIFAGLGVVAGVPDLIIIHGGKVFGLELKSGTGRLTAAQVATQANMVRAGATVATATGIDEAIGLLTEWGLLKAQTRGPGAGVRAGSKIFQQREQSPDGQSDARSAIPIQERRTNP